MNIDHGKKSFFREIQYYRQRWVLLLLMAAAGISWYSFLNSILFKVPLSNNPIPVWISVPLWFIFGLLVPVFLYTTRLVTEVEPDGLHIKFHPFSTRTIKYSDIKSITPVEEIPAENRSLLNIHFGQGTQPVFHINGNKAINILLQTGENVQLGSEDPEVLVKAISRQLKPIKDSEKGTFKIS